MSIEHIYKGSKLIETLDNYSLAFQLAGRASRKGESKRSKNIHDEKVFWTEVLKKPEASWFKVFNLNRFVISEWVARVPGLYYSDSSSAFRTIMDKDIAEFKGNHMELYPDAKSRIVSEGGIGTLLFPPDDEEKRLVSLSARQNASTGIPALVYPEVWEELKLGQGKMINIRNCKWQPLSFSWAKRFASTKNIPRGYFIIKNSKEITVYNTNLPIDYHPFSIMEYEKGNTLLYDYVFVTANTRFKKAEKEMETFFKSYAAKEGRNGHYLINPNLINPLFQAEFMSPDEMRDPSERAKLELLKKRITTANFSFTNLNELLQKLPSYYESSTSIKRLARNIGVSQSLLKDDNAANMSAQLINYCLQTNKIEELADRMAVEYPQIFKTI